jgi:4-amino-4-deoxy-L-arabinose transferase-like glycosyltransferase
VCPRAAACEYNFGVPQPLADRRDLALLLVLVAALLLAGLGRSALTDRDEGANAGAAREMRERGAWLTPTLNDEPRFAKPALVYWLMTGSAAVLGVGETAARLPSALAAALLVLAQYGFARWALGAEAGLRAALILLLGVEYVLVGRMALTDATLVLWTSLAGFAFFRAHHGSAPRGPWYAGMYLALALAMLTKGPVGVLVPGLAIAAYLLVTGEARRFWRQAAPGRGLLLFALVALPWYGAMLWQHGGEYLARAQAETLGRVARTVTGPGGTPLFYLPVVLIGFFPWSAFLPGALVETLRGARRRAAASRADAALVFAALWVASGLVAFSLARSRLPHYVLPVFPAAALLVAGRWPPVAPALGRALLAGLGVLIAAAAGLALGLGATLAQALEPAYPAEPAARLPSSVLAVAGLALVMGAGALVRDGARLFRLLAVAMTLLLAVGVHAVLPAFSATWVAPPTLLARRAGAEARPCDVVAVLGPYRPSFLFYAGRRLDFVRRDDPGRLTAAAGPGQRLWLITPRAQAERLPPVLAALPVLETRGGYQLMAGPPVTAPCP